MHLRDEDIRLLSNIVEAKVRELEHLRAEGQKYKNDLMVGNAEAMLERVRTVKLQIVGEMVQRRLI